MTVNDLINKLLDYPSNMRVLTLGYEGGYNDTDLKTDHIVFDINDKDTWYIGPHDSVTMFPDSNVAGQECLIITRGK